MIDFRWGLVSMVVNLHDLLIKKFYIMTFKEVFNEALNLVNEEFVRAFM